MESSRSERRPTCIAILVATVLLVGLCWGALIPPFEAADESAFYNEVIGYAHGQRLGGWLLYASALKPVIRAAGGAARPLQARFNPSFRFVSNQRGRVNVFIHGRAEGMPRGDVNRLYLLRLCTLFIWMMSLLLIFETARLVMGRGDLALLTAGACLLVPEVSFFASKIHPEATTVLLASAAYWAFTARIYGRIGRIAIWAIAIAVLLTAPFSDRQAYFLVLFIPFGLVVTEPTRRGAVTTAALLLAVAGIGFLAIPRPAEMARDLTMWFRPMLTFFRFEWWNPYLFAHLKYEFAPKMFFGFWGWLGQPSVLLPAPVYAAFAVVSVCALIGFALRVRSSGARRDGRQMRLAWIYAGGILFTFAPILYTNVMIERIVVGRWMLPSLAPIMIALVYGLSGFAGAVRMQPRRIALIVAAVGAALALIWISPAGALIRDGIRAHHYGDQEHLIRVVGDAIAGLLIAAAIVAMLVRQRRPADQSVARVAAGWPDRTSTRRVFAALVLLNLALLFAFVVPLYRPFDEDEYATAVRGEAAEGEYDRAAALLVIAKRAYPQSPALARLAIENPLIPLRGGSDELLTEFEERVGRGQGLDNRDEIMALARAVRRAGWFETIVLADALDKAPAAPDLREPLALLRAEIDGRQRDGSAAAEILRSGNGTTKQVVMHNVATLEGFTVHRRHDRKTLEVRVYFRPLRDWAPTMKLEFGAMPRGSAVGPSLVEPVEPLFTAWRAGELAWETYELPASTTWHVWVRVEVARNSGDPYDLGVIGG